MSQVVITGTGLSTPEHASDNAGHLASLELHRDDLASGALGVVCSFGAGYSAGSVVVCRQ